MRREKVIAAQIDCDACGAVDQGAYVGNELPPGWIHLRMIMRSMDICADCSKKPTTIHAFLKQFSPEHGKI